MSSYVVEVTEATFEQEVIARSHQVPVMVDFWAPWCSPCRTLTPILERVTEDLDGAVVLAKIDSDENPFLSGQLGVRGIPNVILFKDGTPADRFVGALPENGVRGFLSRFVTTVADEEVARAATHAAAGEVAEARAAYGRALEANPEADAAYLGLARLAMSEGRLDAVSTFADRIRPTSDEAEVGRALKSALEMVSAALDGGSRDELEARLVADDNDLEARFALTGHEIAAGNHRAALGQLLAIVRADKSWREETARKTMLMVFNIVGAREPLSDEFRDQLRSIYY